VRISGEKRSDLYSAFAARINDLRVELKIDHCLRMDDEALDAKLFKLEQQIWVDIKATLNI